MNDESNDCPYCHSQTECPHLLLLVDMTFRSAVGGQLMQEFNRLWSEQCEIGGDDFDEREPFQELLDSVDCCSTASNEWDFEGGPGQSSRFAAFYVEDDRAAGEARKHLIAYGAEKGADLASNVDAIKNKLTSLGVQPSSNVVKKFDLNNFDPTVKSIVVPLSTLNKARSAMKKDKRIRHFLYHGELSDMPGRDESFDEYLTYLGRSRWKLESEGTDFSGIQSAEPMSELFGTADLIKWVIERDDEDASPISIADVEEEDSEAGRQLGTRMTRLYEIAKAESATFCVQCIEKWQTGNWPSEKKLPSVKIIEIRGVVLRGVWIRVYKACFDAVTNLGPAFLSPPSSDGYATLVLKSDSSMSQGRTIKLNKALMKRVVELTPELVALQNARGAR